MRARRTTVAGLATRIWLPDGAPRAVLVSRTPYGAAQHAAEGAGWAEHGVALVVQDVRGRHESPGEFHPYREGASDDGPALLRWVRSWAEAPVVLLGVSYGAHAALATVRAAACPEEEPDGVVVAVPALGLGETARTRGGVLQLASRMGWWLAHDVRRPWHDVLSARRTDAERAEAVARVACPLLAIGGTDDYFAHDTVALAEAWGGPTRTVLGPWGHSLDGARRGARIVAWLDTLLAGQVSTGTTTIDRDGVARDGAPGMGVVHLDPGFVRGRGSVAGIGPGAGPWCASLRVATAEGGVREIAHGAAFGPTITLGPVVLTEHERSSVHLHLADEDFPRYARSPHLAVHRPVPGLSTVPDHRWEITA